MIEKGESLLIGKFVRVPADKLKDFVIKVLEKLDVPHEDAEITADILVRADLRGIESHGVARLRRYVDGIKNGVVKTKPNIRIVLETPVSALVDGDYGLGQVIAYKAMKIAIEKAKKNYVGLVGVKNSNHFGIAGYYALMAVKEDMIGLTLTNTRPLVAPTYGKKKVIGTNPIALAAPTKGEPFVLDMATSVAPSGKLEVAKRLGEKVPEGWGIDPEGKITRDPDMISKGALLPLGGLGEELGGHKGYGLSMAVDILSGILTGANFGPYVGQTQGPTPANVGHFFAALRIDAFMPVEEFKERMSKYIEILKKTEKIPGAEEIYIPGEKSAFTEKVRKEKGVALDLKTIDMLKKTAEEFGIPFELA